MKAALLVIDLQEDFLPPYGSLAVPEGREIIAYINELCDKSKYKFDVVIASKDWHPQNHCSFASNNPGSKPFDTVVFKNPIDPQQTKAQVVWPDHCVQNSFGSEYPKDFDHEKVDAEVMKGFLSDREYYSAFADVWGLHHTELNDLLKKHEITHVFVTGLAYDFCVLHTSLDAANNGYATYVISDACRPVDGTKLDQIVASYTKGHVHVISYSDPILDCVKAK